MTNTFVTMPKQEYMALKAVMDEPSEDAIQAGIDILMKSGYLDEGEYFLPKLEAVVKDVFLAIQLFKDDSPVSTKPNPCTHENASWTIYDNGKVFLCYDCGKMKIVGEVSARDFTLHEFSESKDRADRCATCQRPLGHPNHAAEQGQKT